MGLSDGDGRVSPLLPCRRNCNVHTFFALSSGCSRGRQHHQLWRSNDRRLCGIFRSWRPNPACCPTLSAPPLNNPVTLDEEHIFIMSFFSRLFYYFMLIERSGAKLGAVPWIGRRSTWCLFRAVPPLQTPSRRPAPRTRLPKPGCLDNDTLAIQHDVGLWMQTPTVSTPCTQTAIGHGSPMVIELLSYWLWRYIHPCCQRYRNPSPSIDLEGRYNTSSATPRSSAPKRKSDVHWARHLTCSWISI